MDKNWKTWLDWALCSKPADRLEQAYLDGSLKTYSIFNELEQTEQNSKWHPEGNVWVHTLYVVEAAGEIAQRESLSSEDTAVLLISALCHDLGKPDTTTVEDGRIRSKGHAQVGAEITEEFLRSIDCPEQNRLKIVALVREHLVYSSFQTVTVRAVKRLLKRLEPASLDDLLMLVEADHSGRPPLPKKLPEIMHEIKGLSLKLES